VLGLVIQLAAASAAVAADLSASGILEAAGWLLLLHLAAANLLLSQR
jgi:hypothetical protein